MSLSGQVLACKTSKSLNLNKDISQNFRHPFLGKREAELLKEITESTSKDKRVTTPIV